MFGLCIAIGLGLASATSAHLVRTLSTVQGFDISHYQNTVDFQAAYNAGSRFVIIKVTDGNTFKDPKHHDHLTKASNVGFITGAYHFARPNSGNGSRQALFFLANGGAWRSDGMTLPGMLDMEYNPSAGSPPCYGLSQSQMVTWLVDFVDVYSGTTGRFPMIYTSNDFWRTCTGNYNGFANYCPLVLTRYAAAPGAIPGEWPIYTIWQNSNSYRFGGDSDLFNGDETALLALASGSSALDASASNCPMHDRVSTAQQTVLLEPQM